MSPARCPGRASPDSILVEGTYSGLPNTGITVQGIVAQTDGNRFYANNVPLSLGDNTLTVTATTPQGGTASQTLMVTSTGLSPIQVVAAPSEGVAPLTVSLSVTNKTGGTLQKIDADFDGNGSIDFTTVDPNAPPTFTYATPGSFRAKVTVNDSQDNVYSQTVIITVEDAQQMDQVFQTIWAGMNNALIGNRSPAPS